MNKTLAFLSIVAILTVLHSCSGQENEDPLEGLKRNIPGTPGKDYPIFSTNILCKINPANPGCSSGGGKKKKANNGNAGK